MPLLPISPHFPHFFLIIFVLVKEPLAPVSGAGWTEAYTLPSTHFQAVAANLVPLRSGDVRDETQPSDPQQTLMMRFLYSIATQMFADVKPIEKNEKEQLMRLLAAPCVAVGLLCRCRQRTGRALLDDEIAQMINNWKTSLNPEA